MVAVALALTTAVGGSADAGPPGVTEMQVYKEGLDFPVDMVRLPSKRAILFTEKTGAVRVLRRRRLVNAPCATLNVNTAGEQGAAGIALHPSFPSNGFVYVYFSSAAHDDNRVARFVYENGSCTNKTIIFKGIPAETIHNGGQLEFLDDHLFVSTGDASEPASAQDTSELGGKILRLNPDGSVPEDNPFDNPVWSYGHRNPFGLAGRPGTTQLFESENGPSCDDELNLIASETNFGWGAGYTCNGPPVGPSPRAPLRDWTPTIVPTDMVWYKGPLDEADDRLLMADFKSGGKIHSFDMSADGTTIEDSDVLYDGPEGIVDVARGPGGWVYFITPSYSEGEGEIRRLVEGATP